MREMRQVWVETNQLRGGGTVQVGQVTTVCDDDVDTWALRRWDRSEPLQLDSVVKVVETRPYGAVLVTEIPDGDEVLKAVGRMRRELAWIEQHACQEDRDEYREEVARLNALVDRFPVPVEYVEA